MRFRDDDDFLRRIPHWQFDFDTRRVLPFAFKLFRLSVNWSKYATVDQTVEGHQGWGVASITALDCYSAGQDIEYKPQPDNLAHCDVVGEKTNRIQRRLNKAAKLLLFPTRPDSANPGLSVTIT